ncbi:NmrA family NAD(P)-binding protein [Aliiroseovarius sp. Z3]|uniref:SDR family oxidoreductase n=1 Tax=Aliiroseovarius sp. Z3 TaxID=2811402 RepID=UPI0023B22680|nr:NmrA family NAD(P)-binding protein [Aliiroseovarius sp. Z3]MDE9449266.1 NmrA family NAD(P)-binding protein [Aliiroseovarius sp. Z3]
MKTIFIAGATGYLGSHLCAQFKVANWRVVAQVRDANSQRAKALDCDALVQSDLTSVDQLTEHLQGVDSVCSCIGITRQRDGVTYEDVDYGLNANLLKAALAAHVEQFAYVHVFGAESLLDCKLVAAKEKFAQSLRHAPIRHSIIAPTGYFSDMADFLSMAKSGRVYLFGDGSMKMNPISGQDLAQACVEAITKNTEEFPVGGPQVFTHRELAILTFESLGKPAKIMHLPMWLNHLVTFLLRRLTPVRIHGPIEFFLTAMRQDMVAPQTGDQTLDAYFRSLQTSHKTQK